MRTKIRVVSRALVRLGRAPVNDLESGGDVVASVAAEYEPAVEFALKRYNWSFAKAYFQLSRLTATPPKGLGWRYAFELPADFLQLNKTYPPMDFDVRERLLYSNNTEVAIDYTFRADESRFTVDFEEYLIVQLAANVCMQVTSKAELKQQLDKQAKDLYRLATFNESRGRRPRPIMSNPIYYSRF